MYLSSIVHSEVPWRPLSSFREEIRILEVSPAQSSSDSIICHLQTVSLLDQPEYEALSYVWGSSSGSRQIFLNGKKIAVTDSLFSALTHIRDVKQPRIIWVDAVCINQKDNAEKSIQVMMMGKIYSQASRVLVWLLEYEPQELINDIVSFGEDQEKHYTEIPFSLFILARIDWWHRAWTFQEAGLARNLIFYVADKQFTLKDLEVYCNSLFRHLFRPEACCQAAFSAGFNNGGSIAQQPFGAALRTLQKLLGCRKSMSQNKQNLLNVIVENNDRAATNLRDKVYAYLGSACDIPADFIKYELPLKEWNIYISTKLIQHSMSLKTLRYTSHSGIYKDESKRMDGLPSWCPDWTRSVRDRIFLETRQQDAILESQYAASAQTKADPLFLTEEVLSVKGILCDAITHVGCGSNHVSGPGSDPKALQQWCHLVAHSTSVHLAICDEYLDQAPAVVITKLENGYNVRGSSWEKLWEMNYPFSEGDTVQDAFRKVLVANLSLFGLVEGATLSASETEPFLQEIAFNEFWSSKIENRPAVAIPIKEGYTSDQVSLMLISVTEQHITFLSRMIAILLNGKRLFVSNKGYIGWGPAAMMPGDTIAVLYGSNMPFVLRPVPDLKSKAGLCNAYTLVGECYVHGLMKGEALQNAKMDEQDFLLY
ncbi:hypothetical protein CFAM422_000863 [Trichoderma lentiforme]|uniref:Heterokaryon incompatibility domain-containing protein n=1 Tax=Trichoderma lentiforme TaxID=1567552 RepID=A0A9P4XP95_9HYPO|nr:hypothetical protein CFAM422_000863 [Trichoderma lentiforme]